MDADATSRAVQGWPIGKHGMTAVDSGTGSYRFIVWNLPREDVESDDFQVQGSYVVLHWRSGNREAI